VSLSADGKTVAIGASANDPTEDLVDAGHVRVYYYDEESDEWYQLGGEINGEYYGYYGYGGELGTGVSISSDGKTLAIGAPYSHSNGYYGGVGKVYEYKEVSMTWVQVGGDIESDCSNEEFGGWVSISADGKIVAVGGSEYYYALGRVQVFENSCEI